MTEEVQYIDGIRIPNDENGKPVTAAKFHLPKTYFWFKNSRDQKLHVRYFLPDDPEKLKLVIISYHGYTANVSGEYEVKHGNLLSNENFAVFKFDFVGHGYSEGERAYIENYEYWVKDAFKMLELVLIDGCDSKENECNFGIDTEIWGDKLKKAKFAVSGGSLGGGIGILISHEIILRHPKLSERFIGAVLIAPAIKGVLPPAAVLFILRHVICRLFPKRLIPSMIDTVHVPTIIWLKDEDFMKFKLNQWGRPGALGWGYNTRFGTGLAMVQVIENVQKVVPEVTIPFIIIQDPEDGIVPFEGSKMLFEKCATPSNISRGKEIKEMKGLLHDLLTNACEEVCDATIDWLNHQLENGK